MLTAFPWNNDFNGTIKPVNTALKSCTHLLLVTVPVAILRQMFHKYSSHKELKDPMSPLPLFVSLLFKCIMIDTSL